MNTSYQYPVWIRCSNNREKFDFTWGNKYTIDNNKHNRHILNTFVYILQINELRIQSKTVAVIELIVSKKFKASAKSIFDGVELEITLMLHLLVPARCVARSSGQRSLAAGEQDAVSKFNIKRCPDIFLPRYKIIGDGLFEAESCRNIWCIRVPKKENKKSLVYYICRSICTIFVLR